MLEAGNYAELFARTNYSFLRGASHPEEMVKEAALLGVRALGLADRNGVYGLPKAWWEAKNHPGFHLIVGAEVVLADGLPPLRLLAENRAGYGRLCRLLTDAHAGKEKGGAELGLSQLSVHGTDGLLAFPDLPPQGPTWNKSQLSFLGDLFPGRTWVPLVRAQDGQDAARTRIALDAQQSHGFVPVATNFPHFHHSDRRPLHDTLTAIREGESLKSAGFHLHSNGERWLKPAHKMEELFRDFPEALRETLEIVDRCTFRMDELRYRYPSEWIPDHHTAQSFLEELSWRGARVRWEGEPPEKVMAQITHELGLIGQLGFADYFLTIWDLVEFARSRKILCQGRGSAANSVVCYALGITAIDPVRMNLLFERFISAERNEPPDIDVDFEHERREEVIQYLYEKYGRNRAAMVSAVITYRTRSAIREVAKALGFDVGTLSAKKVNKEFNLLSAPTGVKDPRDRLDSLVAELKGFPRHISIHSGGFCLSADPITEIVPVEPARMEGRTIIQWDKYDLDYLGLMKVDVLSLGMLSALRRTLDMIGKELHEIPADDPQTFEMIRKADTVGTFQIESRAQMQMLGRLLPKDFYDIVVQVAIVRPGPITGKMVHPYLRRRRGEEPVEYAHPKLKEILGKTLGVPLFQEQVMKIAVELGGFTPGEADELRRAIGAWRSSGSIEKMGKRLKEGLLRSGLSEDFSQRVFDQIQGFAQYGFPESHAASFALLAWASSWLKCHHPAEFTCALLNSQPMGFYAPHTLIDDAKRHGVEVLPLHPNLSQWESRIERGAIRLGWQSVRGMSREEADRIVARKPWRTLGDFVARTMLRSHVLERLAMGDALSCFGLDQRHTLWQILAAGAIQGKPEAKQMDLFASHTPESDRGLFARLSLMEEVREHYDSFGLSAKHHPMRVLRASLPLPKLTSVGVKGCSHGTKIAVSGLTLVRQKPPTANGTCFATLEDEFGFVDLILWKDVFASFKEVFLENCFLKVRGTVQRDRNTVSVLVESLAAVWGNETSGQPNLNIEPVTYFF